jgi:alpha-D-xyloside xylohydrolase
MLYTHNLERNNVMRASVVQAAVVETGANHVLLATTAVAAAKKKISSADPAMFNRRQQARVGVEIAGRLRLDVVSDAILRVRYFEGAEVPEHVTPMLVEHGLKAVHCDIRLAAGEVTIMTTAMRVVIALNPYRIEAYRPDGTLIYGVGGPEKNNFCEWDAYNTGICRTAETEQPLAVECFDLRPGEAIYGFGETFTGLNKAGQRLDLSLADPHGVTTPRCYKCVPFYVSSHGYGVFFNHSSEMTFWVGSMSAADITVAAQDDFLDYFVIAGTIKGVLAGYTDLTGKGVMPPAWTFGFWQSKISYQSADEILEIARELRRNEVPCDVIHLDTFWFKKDWQCDLEFSSDRFPDPAACFAELARLGIKVSLWQLPYIPEGSQLFADLKAVEGFVKTSTGEIYDSGVCFTPGFKGVVGVIDYSNPAAVRVHQDYFRRLFRLGAKVIKTDFGEEAPADGVYFDGTPGAQMHNLYPLLYNRALFDVTREETGDGVVWARSAWAGSQRYPLHWGGDNSPNYHNIIPQLVGGLSFGLSGFQFWSEDIGGFCGDTNDPLLIRWMQLGMFLSHSRIHGSGSRELYKFAPETLRICRDYLKLRYRLLPYILGQAAQCVRDSLPMARALVVEYQDDPNVRNLADEYLFGDSFLVAPIYTPDGRRQVYLPAGMWTDWWTQERLPGNRWLDIQAPLERLPLYVREGAIIPLGPDQQYVGDKPVDHLTLLVSLFTGDGQTSLTIPVAGGELTLSYMAAGGQHRLHLVGPPVLCDVQTLGIGQMIIERCKT